MGFPSRLRRVNGAFEGLSRFLFLIENHFTGFSLFSCVRVAFNARFLHSSFVSEASIRALLVIHDLDLSAPIPVKTEKKCWKKKVGNISEIIAIDAAGSWIYKGNSIYLPKNARAYHTRNRWFFLFVPCVRARPFVRVTHDIYFIGFSVIFDVLFIASVQRADTFYPVCFLYGEKRHRQATDCIYSLLNRWISAVGWQWKQKTVPTTHTQQAWTYLINSKITHPCKRFTK